MNRINTVLEVFDGCAKEYEDKFMNFALYNDTFDLFCDHVSKEKAAILELGCGPGNVTRYLLNRRPDFSILGVDISSNMIELARKNNPAAEFEIMDCRKIGNLEGEYDGIVCGFCLPYLSKEEALHLIPDAAKLLSTGGVFYLSTMEDDNSSSRYEKSSSGKYETFINYHEAHYLTKALAENSFKVLDLQRKKSIQPNGTPTTDLFIIARMV